MTGDQCMCGLKAKDGDKVGPARKGTGFMTNSPCIAQALSRRCPNANTKKVHHHVRLENGRIKVAQIYPQALCKQFVKGSGHNWWLTGKGSSYWPKWRWATAVMGRN